MLTDTALRNLKPGAAPYKLAHRDGMYVTVSTAGTIAFRYDYRLNGRRETLTIGRYGPAGISLAMARERRHMLQEWANMVDVWVESGAYTATLLPASLSVPTLRALV